MNNKMLAFAFLATMIAFQPVHAGKSKRKKKRPPAAQQAPTSHSKAYGWEMTDFVWNFGIIQGCDVGMRMQPVEFFVKEQDFDRAAYHNIKSGDVVWMKSGWVPQFYREVLPGLDASVVLVISDGDESFPSDSCQGIDAEALINNEKIIHIFAQNCDYKGPFSDKISQIPIAVDFHTIGYKVYQGRHGGWGEEGSPLKQEADLKALLQTFQPTYLRKPRVFVDFQHSNSSRGNYDRYLQFGEDRQDIFNQLLITGMIDYTSVMRRSRLWKTKGEYAFSISPHGNGLDCHRTWEDLILGCIVIVKTSSLDTLYEGLPVVIVKDWSEVNEQNMKKWLSKYGDAFTNPSYREKLTNAYWIQKIRSVAKPYKN